MKGATRMRGKGRQIGLQLVSLILFGCFIAESAYGLTILSGEAIIKWNSLNIVTDPGVSLTWIGAYNSESYADGGVKQTVPGWGDTSSGGGNVYAYTNDDEIYALAGTGPYGYAKSYAVRIGQFLVSGTGAITFSADYLLSSILLSYDPKYYSYEVISEVYFEGKSDFPYGYTQRIFWDEIFLNNIWSPASPFTETKSGTFVYTHNYKDGEVGLFGAWAQSRVHAGVPEPATMLLLGLGLGGLASLARKKLF